MTQDEFERISKQWLKRGTWTPRQAARLFGEQRPMRPPYIDEDAPETGVALHVLDLAQSFPECRTERTPQDWLAWAKSLGLHINSALLSVAHNAANEAGSQAGKGVLVNSSKRKRTSALAAVIEAAKKKAADPNDWASVWNELVAMAKSKERPAPLLGYVESEGVKYQNDKDNEPVKYLTRSGFKQRFSRANK